LDPGQLPLFLDVDPAPVEAALAGARRLRLAAGERLLEAGQPNRHLYLLLAGRMEARLSDAAEQPGMPIAHGETIGEMSMLDGEPASAHVYAVDACEVLAIHEDLFWGRLAPLPGVMRNLTRLVVQRVRAASERLVRSLEEELKYTHLKQELAAARDIQTGLLPHAAPLFPRHPEVEVHACLLPAKEVGGDLYDAFALDDEHILVAVGDVSGKGLPAALFMMRTVTLLRARRGGGPPDVDFLSTLNCLLGEGNDAEMFATLCIVVLSVRSGRLTLFNAGHPPLLLSRRGEPFAAVSGARGALLGMLPQVRFQPLELTLGPGDRLLLYSDGITEAENPARDLYTQARARAALDRCAADLPLRELVDGLLADVQSFAAGADQSDDIAVLALRYRG
jgi:sigma-B regulation protein RsbU (phosphoserine phosphatase)